MADTHFGFIAMSYAAAVVLVGGLALWIWLDRAAQQRKLALFEAGARVGQP